MDDPEVVAKKAAAESWCEHASRHGGKPWVYKVIPHDRIAANRDIKGPLKVT